MPLSLWGSLGIVITRLLQILLQVLVSHPVTSNTGLLSSYLNTFQETSCDGEPMKMSCPQGMLVSIQYAQYGRHVPSSEMCPSSAQQNQNPTAIFPRLEDTDCLATTSLKVIMDACQDKPKCHLVTSTVTFQQDPCPGTKKYLEVAYKCRPNQFSSETVCEGDQLELRCSRSTRIVISSALFGRTPLGDPKCPELLRNTSIIKSACQSKVVVDELVTLCQGKKWCVIEAGEYLFGNPCPHGVNKYLNVVYTCVPKHVLKPVQKNNRRKHRKYKHNESARIADISSDINVQSSPFHNKVQPDNQASSTKEEPEQFPADAAPSNSYISLEQYPKHEVVGEIKSSKKDINESSVTVNKESNSYKIGVTTPCLNYTATKDHSGRSATGLITNWLNAFNFVNENREKAMLYLVLGISFGIIFLLFLVIIQLAVMNKRKTKAKLDVSEPVHPDHPVPANHTEVPTLDRIRSDSMDRIEVVRFNPTRSRDFATCTLRSDIADRSLTNC